MTTLDVLLVEDDLDLAATVVDYLELESIQCDHAANGIAGLNLIEENNYQVVILDINLPKLDGFSVCERLRNAGDSVPVLMLTAKDTLDDKLTGFRVGTDDYLVKPFELSELVARVKALSGRKSSRANQIAVADVTLNLNSKLAKRGDRQLRLSPTCLSLLQTLMQASPNPVSRQSLVERVWGHDAPDSNSLKVHIFNLRKELEHQHETKLIHTRPGFGFAMYEE